MSVWFGVHIVQLGFETINETYIDIHWAIRSLETGSKQTRRETNKQKSKVGMAQDQLNRGDIQDQLYPIRLEGWTPNT